MEQLCVITPPTVCVLCALCSLLQAAGGWSWSVTYTFNIGAGAATVLRDWIGYRIFSSTWFTPFKGSVLLMSYFYSFNGQPP